MESNLTQINPDHSKTKKPLIKYYFFAYGVPTLIVIVTASTAGIDNYQNDEFCYLASSIKVSMVPFIGGLVVPCVLISTVMIGFGLSVLCVLSTSPYKVTETENDTKTDDFLTVFSIFYAFFMLYLSWNSVSLSSILNVVVSGSVNLAHIIWRLYYGHFLHF